jgi:pimeloyl-ACP methyl ester carboxylesterase
VSSIITHQGIVHYETYGSGAPVIFLHGWLGSWGLWQPTMEALGQTHRCYALDFWGFGESGKKRDSYAVTEFMELVRDFMDALGIETAPLIGHSMGGTTSLGTAIRYPTRITKVCVIGSPIMGASLSPVLKLAGVPWIGTLMRGTPGAFKLGMRLWSPMITRTPKTWYPMIARDLSRTTVESFFSSVGSLRRTDLRSQLGNVHIPVMGIYGMRDVIVHPKQYELLQAGVKQAQIEILRQSGHFPMLDEPEAYLDLIKSFLNGAPGGAEKRML